MKATIATLSIVLFAGIASANDGSTPYIEVLGVNPNGNPVDSKIDVYGKEMKTFFDVLPVDFVYAEESRSIQFISGSYIASISCSRQYTRPTTGQTRTDHKCTFANYKRADWWGDPTSPDYDGDSYVVVSGDLGNMDKSNLRVLGIHPQGVKKGLVYSVYGNNTGQVARPVIQVARSSLEGS